LGSPTSLVRRHHIFETPNSTIYGAIWGRGGAIWGLGGAIWGLGGAIWGLDGAIWGLDGAIWGLLVVLLGDSSEGAAPEELL